MKRCLRVPLQPHREPRSKIETLRHSFVSDSWPRLPACSEGGPCDPAKSALRMRESCLDCQGCTVPRKSRTIPHLASAGKNTGNWSSMIWCAPADFGMRLRSFHDLLNAPCQPNDLGPILLGEILRMSQAIAETLDL